MEDCRVCLFNDSFPPVVDGVANTVVNYATEINKSFGRAFVATPDHPDANDGKFPFDVLRYTSFDTRKSIGYMAGFPFSPELSGRMAKEGVSILHSHCPFISTMLARELRKTLDAPLIFTYHTKFDIDIATIVKRRLIQSGVTRVVVQNISACDEVWAVSRGAGENLRALGYEGDYIVMENGVDMPLGRAPQKDIDAAVQGYDLPGNVPVFLYVGRIMWYKGLKITLDALAKLKKLGIDFRMVFIGDGEHRPEVMDYARSRNIGDNCIFTGVIHDRQTIRAWYCRADLFLFPSSYDTNGLVVREAAACSLASVLIKDSCASEGVTDGQNGFLIEENAGSMASCLRQLILSRDKIKEVGQNAAEQIYISWATAVSRAVERYGIVQENYRRGLYEKKSGPTETFFKAQGEIMQALYKLKGYMR